MSYYITRIFNLSLIHISLGIAKINIHTELCQAAMEAINAHKDEPFLAVEREVRKAVKAVSYTHLLRSLNSALLFRRFMNSSGTATATGTLSLLRQDFQVTVRTLRMQDRYFFMCLIKFSDFSIRLCRTSQKKSGRQFLTRAKQ